MRPTQVSQGSWGSPESWDSSEPTDPRNMLWNRPRPEGQGGNSLKNRCRPAARVESQKAVSVHLLVTGNGSQSWTNKK